MRKRVLVAAVVAVTACAAAPSPPKAPTEPKAPHSSDEPDVAVRLAAVARPCDLAKVADLFDREGFVRLVMQRAPGHDAAMRALETLGSISANKFCAWVASANDVRVMRPHIVEGQRRAVLRKVYETGFGYYDIVASGARILDIYSYDSGTWISQEIADAFLMPGSDDPQAALLVQQAVALDSAGKHGEALAALDALPEPVRVTHPIQAWRVAIAGRISIEAYQQASEELARRFPHDPPTPIAAMNRAFMRHDFVDALHQLDVLDAAIGGDPFLDAIRASILVFRHDPGDLEAAAARAERAAQAEPKLMMTQLVRLGTAFALERWAKAISSLDAIERDVGVVVSDDQLRRLPNAARFMTTPEYASWRHDHP